MSGLWVHTRVRPVENHHPLRENHLEPRILDNSQAAAAISILLINKHLSKNETTDRNLATALHCLYSNGLKEQS
jgi:hypothetical protein